MNNKLYLISGIGVVLVAAVFVYSLGHFLGSQRTSTQGLWKAVPSAAASTMANCRSAP
ncbi:MAG: hypothetical protein P1U82_05940 [Verrucomicrobiales bacterium]|nr:hypothetical protein [Verrucomicrobiales bacterium]